jgi:hypothetical protein
MGFQMRIRLPGRRGERRADRYSDLSIRATLVRRDDKGRPRAARRIERIDAFPRAPAANLSLTGNSP